MAKEYSYGIAPYKVMNGYFYVLLNKTSKVSYWNFFKGKRENDESPNETATREFYEETGMLVSDNDFEEYFFQKNKRKDIGIFLVNFDKYTEDFNFQEKEIYSASWVQLNSIITSPNQQNIINQIEELFEDRKELIRLKK